MWLVTKFVFISLARQYTVNTLCGRSRSSIENIMESTRTCREVSLFIWCILKRTKYHQVIFFLSSFHFPFLGDFAYNMDTVRHFFVLCLILYCFWPFFFSVFGEWFLLMFMYFSTANPFPRKSVNYFDP